MLRLLGGPKQLCSGLTLLDQLKRPVPLVHDGKVVPEMLA